MSQSYGRQDETYIANADLSGNQFRAVVVTAEYTVGVAGANVRWLGVQQDLPIKGQAGMPCAVRRSGTTKVIAGAAFAAGVPLTSDAAGRAVQATAGQYINGYALEPASALGDVIEMTLELAGTV